MSERLSKFTPVHEVLQRAERFHDTASALLFQWGKEDEGGRRGSFFNVAAEHERETADSLARAIAGDIDWGSAETYYQNPPESIPTGDDLQALASQRQDLEAFASELHALHQRWVTIYESLEATNSARRVTELLGNCRGLVERLQRQLSSAQVQLQDL